MDVVRTDSGYVSGTVLGEPDKPVYVFRGIPYAAPPVGALRWKAPQLATPWSGIRECTVFSKAAPQSSVAYGPWPTMPQSEDCLYLNVLTPARQSRERLPVMVWIHGGGYSFWTGNESLWNGVRLPSHGVVQVNINFRIGPMGFLAHPLLSGESPDGTSGNYLFLDVLAALRWVRRNISAFGGDPDNVTVFGESSGSLTVVSLMASALAKGLFHRAIGESGSPRNVVSLSEQESRGEKVFLKLGVDKEEDPLGAARSVPWQRVIEAGAAATAELKVAFGLWNAFVDGSFLPDTPANIFKAGRQNVVPFLMVGNQAELEYMGLIPSYVNLFGGANRAGGKAYACIFDQVPVGWKTIGTPGAFHTAELPYVFGDWEDWTQRADFWPVLSNYATRFWPMLTNNSTVVANKLPDPGLTEIDKKVSETMMTMWSNFARTGNPSIKGVVDWPAWDEATERYLNITQEPEVRSGFSKLGQK